MTDHQVSAQSLSDLKLLTQIVRRVDELTPAAQLWLHDYVARQLGIKTD